MKTAKTAAASRFDYAPERIWNARHAYFDEDRVPDGDLVDEALLRSWQRCRGDGRSVGEHVAFDPVGREALARLVDEQRALLDAAAPELQQLAGAMSDAGYAVLLTDAQGRVLAVSGSIDRRSAPLRQAFRPGVDVSEATIGTTAMSLAIAERQAVRVLGPEHFFVDNQIFHCCAAPVLDPRGRLLGVVDATRDMPGLAAGAMALTRRCARRIERRLFDRVPAFVRISLEAHDTSEDARLAFDRDGRLIAASPAACRLVDVPFLPDGLSFEDMFEDRFHGFVSSLRRDGDLHVRLHGGVQLRVQAASASTGTPLPAGRRKPPQIEQGARAQTQAPADPAFASALGQAARAFDAGLPILVTGETGAGKEVAARALHAASRRSDGPLVAINCGAIAPELVASELFGHVEGAYTGARRGGSMGRIATAQGGTVLLDEIGEMPLDLQVALLRVLDENEVTPVGGTRPVAVDVRFICATHRDLPALVAAGRFREDLYYRLGGYVLPVPALRARSDFDAVLDSVCVRIGCDPKRLDAGLRRALRALRWPGNVRQLQHALTLAAAMAPEREPLRLDHFPQSVESPPMRAAGSEAAASSLKELREQAIDAALRQTHGNVAAAARLLGMGRATLYRKLAK